MSKLTVAQLSVIVNCNENSITTLTDKMDAQANLINNLTETVDFLVAKVDKLQTKIKNQHNMLNGVGNVIVELRADDHQLEDILIGNQLATTHTLGRQAWNHHWLSMWGINPIALDSEWGKGMLDAIQIVRDGNWYKIRATSSWYKANKARYQQMTVRLCDLAREKGHGCKQTRRNRQNPVTWLLISVEADPTKTKEAATNEPTF